MKIIERIINFFNKLFGKEKRLLLNEAKPINNEIRKNNSAFLSSIKIEDERKERKDLNDLLEIIKQKNKDGNITKDDLLELQEKMETNINILKRSNQKQHEDLNRYEHRLDACLKRLNNNGVE